MTDTARDFQTDDPAATDGLDEIFDVRELDDELGANHEPKGANCLTVEEAASLLGISNRAVQKRLKKGSLRGWKEKTTNGERWVVDADELPSMQDANPVRLGPNCEQEDANPVRSGSNGRELDPEPYQPDLFTIQLQSKLEAATYRIGYLEAQLSERLRDIEERDASIKLLTDSQHNKSSWWSRLKTWFHG
ncbi:MAG: helix-turn-helix domain-containing protein [Candidatus Obscuribacterales bacterium]|nr:helix-turn-helix domain-containing protein [Candidatus Obscuribacterales bacterium]